VSEVVYARVPDSLKQALREYSAARGLSLTRALVEVAERGLEAISTESDLASREAKLEAAAEELKKTRTRLTDAQVRLRAVEERDTAINRAYGAVAERIRQEVAQCPACREPVSGRDLLMRGRCPNCGRALTSLLAPTRAGLDRDEWIALLGALGVLAGLTPADAGGPDHDDDE